MVRPSGMLSCFAAVLMVAAVARADQTVPAEPPPVVFEGFGLGDFEASGSIAAALQGAVEESGSHGPPLDLVVRGPTGRQGVAEPLAAEIRSRIDDLGFSAGLITTPHVIHEGPAVWVGGVQLESAHGEGRELLELRTSMSQAQQSGVFGIELGPRIERRLKRGAVLFLDGKAEAKALRSIETGVWSLPGVASDGTVGVTARTGLSR